MAKPLHEIPENSTVMVDANIVVYASSLQSPKHAVCRQFLERGARSELQLYTVANIVAEIIHRAMVLEILDQGVIQKSAQATLYLKQNPQVVRQLTQYKTVLRGLSSANINILSLTYKDLHSSKQYRDDFGLLANDSLILAVMKREGIQYLATNDADFARVPGISVRQPE